MYAQALQEKNKIQLYNVKVTGVISGTHTHTVIGQQRRQQSTASSRQWEPAWPLQGNMTHVRPSVHRDARVLTIIIRARSLQSSTLAARRVKSIFMPTESLWLMGDVFAHTFNWRFFVMTHVTESRRKKKT